MGTLPSPNFLSISGSEQRSSRSAFRQFAKIPPSRSVPVLFHASAAKWHTVDLLQVRKKRTTSLWLSGLGSNVTRCILAEAERHRSQRGERRARVLLLSPAASPCFLQCRRASSNDLPLLCSAPSAWPWAQAICRLFVPVTSAPMGRETRVCLVFFPELLDRNLRLFLVFYVCGGVMSQTETWREALECKHLSLWLPSFVSL